MEQSMQLASATFAATASGGEIELAKRHRIKHSQTCSNHTERDETGLDVQGIMYRVSQE